jgi:hypothetical protein
VFVTLYFDSRARDYYTICLIVFEHNGKPYDWRFSKIICWLTNLLLPG